MIIDLPDTSKFNYKNGEVKIEDGILKISSLVSWREFIYKLTLAHKGNNCWYCGVKLKKEEITMDHLYPQDLGGPTIPNNLAPSCGRCNVKKGNITEKQYRQILAAPEKQQRAIRSRFMANNEMHKHNKGYYLPREWITSRKIETILVTLLMNESYHGRRYSRIESFYKDYGRIPYPIVVDRNNYLLDGFLVLMFAKNNNISRVPTIVLENVEVIFNR